MILCTPLACLCQCANLVLHCLILDIDCCFLTENQLAVFSISMATIGLCVVKKSAKTAKLDNVFEHIFTPRIYQVSLIVGMFCHNCEA